jgi:CHAT domain-containing protein
MDSLWPVSDSATSLPMGNFYRRVLAREEPAIALRAAQNHLHTLTPGEVRTELAGLQDAVNTWAIDSITTPEYGSTAAGRQGRPWPGDEPSAAPAVPDDYGHPYFSAPFIVLG